MNRLSAMEQRLGAVEQRVGTGPDLSELDTQLDQVRREKESAVAAQEFESAAGMRDREKELQAKKARRHEEWTAAHADLPSLAEEVRALRDEVARLRGLLGERDTGPQDGAA
ncbi:MAG: UvrB/UvrC motif-containing protein [Streptosporangiaceae bacterium]